ncbi:hypothetical protein VTL71DRAFT_9458 [Oculimacula yallundae]|uniref:Uncharacterized protein n=1 Tax=Oculimacula yallundae TaxID=86028 RepID=A0ABR4BUR0_9HELO
MELESFARGQTTKTSAITAEKLLGLVEGFLRNQRARVEPRDDDVMFSNVVEEEEEEEILEDMKVSEGVHLTSDFDLRDNGIVNEFIL